MPAVPGDVGGVSQLRLWGDFETVVEDRNKTPLEIRELGGSTSTINYLFNSLRSWYASCASVHSADDCDLDSSERATRSRRNE